MTSLNAREALLLAAHANHDWQALISLYSERAFEIAQSDIDAACFYMTNAYVFALEADDARAGDCRAFLALHGRE